MSGADETEPEGPLTCSRCGRKVHAVQRNSDGDLCWRCAGDDRRAGLTASDGHAPIPAPLYWDWRCLLCEEPVANHLRLSRRIVLRLRRWAAKRRVGPEGSRSSGPPVVG